MKILITTDLFTTVNGVVISVNNLTEELTKKGHEIRIITTSPERKTYKEDNVYFIRSVPIKIYPGIRAPYSYRNDFTKELIDWNPDVIHSQCEFFSFQYARLISKKTGAPIIHTYHTLYEQYARYVVKNQRFSGKMIAVMSKVRLKHVHTVIAPTEKVKRFLRSYGIENPIQVIPTGISLEKYDHRYTDKEIKEGRAKLGIPENHKVILNLGRVANEKNIQSLLHGFAMLLAKDSNLTFLIVGGGPAKESLEELAKNLCIEKNVIFTGMVKSSEVGFYYQLGDVFVCASTSETQGLTYVEAIANYLPMVCKRDACLDMLLTQGVNGYQYDTLDELVNYLEDILKRPELKEFIMEHDKAIATRFSKQQFAKSIEKVYLEAAGSRLPN